jgi:Uma2 family endonuclease
MAEALLKIETPEYPDISHIVTEDDEPVDNIFSEKQQRLLAESLNCSWNPGHPFIAASNVGIFYAVHEPPVVPDMFLSMDVQLPEDIWEKRHRSYFLWEYQKPPEIVVEIVSNTKGKEVREKFVKYLAIGVRYYVVFDPQKVIQQDVLRIYEMSPGQYIPKIDRYLSRVELGVTLWEGVYENRHDLWLRWCDADKNLIPTGKELAEKAEFDAKKALYEAEYAKCDAEQARREAEQARREAEYAKYDAEQARQRSEGLAEKLRALGIDPDM